MRPVSTPRFAGVYVLEAGAYPQCIEKLEQLTQAIQKQAGQRNIPVEVHEEVRYLGMGDSSIMRYFITGSDYHLRQMTAQRRQAIAAAIAAAQSAADAVARNAFQNTLDQRLDRLVQHGVCDQDDIDRAKQRIALEVTAKGFNAAPPKTPAKVAVRYDLWSHFVVRNHNTKPERANLLKAVRDGHFDVESGKLSPQTPYEPCDTNKAGDWYDEP